MYVYDDSTPTLLRTLCHIFFRSEKCAGGPHPPPPIYIFQVGKMCRSPPPPPPPPAERPFFGAGGRHFATSNQ